jgi:pimeloyl-ACP methyl ester carboxylesterase
MHIRSAFVCLCLFTSIGFVGAEEPAWPELPDKDAAVMIPAQEWPLKPGPRTVEIFIHYPGGKLANVNAETGLMLSLHNWGGTRFIGTADPVELANRFNVVAIGVNYLQSGKDGIKLLGPYDFGYLQALDALRALWFVQNGLTLKKIAFAQGRIYSVGGSGGGNVSLMCNKLAPRTFACIVEMSGMAKLSDAIAFGPEKAVHVTAGYSKDPKSPRYLTPDAQELRFIGNPKHLGVMKQLATACKLVVIHGSNDEKCPTADAREMVSNMQSAKLDVEPHFIEKTDFDGKVVTNTGHGVGDRTQMVFKFADRYLKPGSPELRIRRGQSDFQLRDERVRYPTTNGIYVISYKAGYPVGRFEQAAPSKSSESSSQAEGGISFPGKKSQWQGFDRYDFEVDGRPCFVVVPQSPAQGKPWIWRTEFFGHEPQADLALLKKGFHAVYIDVQNMYGAPVAMKHMDAFYDHLTCRHGLSKKTVLEGFSRGGLFAFNWAAMHPDRVACIYVDAPVCDFKSWPGGKGKGPGSPADWKYLLKVYGLTETQALAYSGNPIDNLAPLAKAGVPIFSVVGDADEVVPLAENTAIVEKRYKQLGGRIDVIVKKGVGHHPHSLQDPAPIVEFILRHTVESQ